MSAEAKVFAVVGDIGGCKEVLPAVQELEKMGVSLEFFVDPGQKAKAGTEVLLKAGRDYQSRFPHPEDRPKAILIGTSATAVEAQIEWTKFGRENGIPVIWLEVLWGTGEREATRSVSPDVMCTLDEIAARIVSSVRPDIRVEITGKPTFGGLAKYIPTQSEITASIRKQLMDQVGLTDNNALFVTYWSGGEDPKRVEEHLKALHKLDRLITHRNVIFAPRLHPKLPADSKENLMKLAFHGNYYIADASKMNPDELTIASSVNIADWGSTGMYTRPLCGVPPVMCLFPDDKERRVRVGYPEGEPPLLLANAGYGVLSGDDLRTMLIHIMNNESRFKTTMVSENAKAFKSLL